MAVYAVWTVLFTWNHMDSLNSHEQTQTVCNRPFWSAPMVLHSAISVHLQYSHIDLHQKVLHTFHERMTIETRVQQHFNNQWSIRTSWELSFLMLLVRVWTLALSLLEPGSCLVDQGQPFALYFPFVWPSVPSLNTHSWAGMESLSPKEWTNYCC